MPDLSVFLSDGLHDLPGGLLLLIIWEALKWLLRYIVRNRVLRAVIAAAIIFVVYLLLWRQYAAFRLYVTPVLTFALGLLLCMLWSRGCFARAGKSLASSLRSLQGRGQTWRDSLLSSAIDPVKWTAVESDPHGMIVPSVDGLVCSWSGGTVYRQSGYLRANLELNTGDFTIACEAKGEQFGTGWDPGLNLYLDSAPDGTQCASLRFVPAGSWGCAQNSICLFVDGRVEERFPVPGKAWVRMALRVSGGKAKASVGESVTSWVAMPAFPRVLLVGPFPCDRPATGSAAKYLLRELEVTPTTP